MVGLGKGPAKWWVRGPRSARHSYYHPTRGVPGIMPFGLIALLGCVAFGVALFHAMHLRHLAREDAKLGAIGIFCLVLGCYPG